MTPQESAMLNDLLGKVQQTRVNDKDPDAEQAIEEAIGSDPDALYILVQTALVQNIALSQARSQTDQLKQQIASLQQQASHPNRATSFLGSLLGHNDPPPQPRPEVLPPPQAAYAPPPYQPVQEYAPAGSGPFGGGYGGGGFGPPSFLRSAATTAAGVAAGALAFEGIESLLHGFGHGGGYGMGGLGGGGFGGAPVEENVVNNYYEGSGSGSGGETHHEHESAFDERPDAASGSGEPKLETASYDPSAGAGDLQGQDDFTPMDPPDETASADDTAFDDSNDNFGDGGGGDGGGDSV